MPVSPWMRPPRETRDISPGEAARLIESGEAMLLDVREPEEWSVGHAPSAQLVPLAELRAEELAAETPVIAVCRSGNRSGTAAERLARAGIDARNLAGGMIAWQQAGLPVVRDDGRAGTV